MLFIIKNKHKKYFCLSFLSLSFLKSFFIKHKGQKMNADLCCWDFGSCLDLLIRIINVIMEHLSVQTHTCSPVQPDIWQTPVERDHVTGHQVELIDFKELFHLVLIFFGNNHSLPHFTWNLMGARHHRWNRESRVTVSVDYI